jgi:WD40 repeat protein/uncharacterized caspase-like protein
MMATDIVSITRKGWRREDWQREALTLLDAASGRVIQTIIISEQKISEQNTQSISPEDRAIRFSPDGRVVAFAFLDKTNQSTRIRTWDVSNGHELMSIDTGPQRAGTHGFPLGPITFAFSDGYRLCAVASGKTIKLFNPAAGRNLATISGHTDEITAVNFSADGKLLATTSFDGTIKIWDVSAAATGKVELARTLSEMAMPVESAAFSDDGRALAVSGGNTVGVWELNTGAALRTINIPAVTHDLYDLIQSPPSVFSPGGRFIVAQSGANEIKLWETRTGREVKSFPIPQGNKLYGAGVSPDGRWVALADDKSLEDVFSSTLPDAPQSTQEFPQSSPAMIPSAPADSTGDSKKDEKARQKEEKERAKQTAKRINELSKQYSEELEKARQSKDIAKTMEINSRILSSAGLLREDEKALMEKQIEQTKQMSEQLKRHSKELEEAQQSGDIRKMMEIFSRIGAGSQPSYFEARLWDVNATSGPRSLPVLPGGITSLGSYVFAFNHDGKLLASYGTSSLIKITEAASGRELFRLTPERGLGVTSLAWSADGSLLASSVEEIGLGVNFTKTDIGNDFSRYSIRLWDAAAWRELRTMTGHTANIRATAFSPDGRLLASGGDDTLVKLWDTTTGREIMTLNGHSQRVKAVAFGGDGKLLVSGGDDGSARLWDVKSGEALATLVTLNNGADWLVVTPDGLFDGTPGAWSQILWRFSPDNIFDVAPVEIFFNDFFYPGLLADIASGKRPRAERDVALKDRRQSILNLSRADNAAGRTIKVKIEVSEPASANQTPTGASDVRLFRNGTLVKVWRGDALKGRKQVALEAEIPIVAGDNHILAYAFNRDGVKSSDAVLNVTGDESLRRKGVAYVIACGVNQYANPQYNLKYAVADAASFGEEVRAQQLKLREYERVEVISLLDKDATKANILFALKRLSNAQSALPAGAPPALSMIQPAQPEDAVFIFFAGHGAAQGSRFYLIPHDLGYAGARDALTAEAVKTILSHGVSDLELEAAIEGVDAGRLLFVVDACNSGQALEAEEKRRGPMNSSGLAQLAYEKGMYILTAAQSYQAALEASQLGHGYLTFALIEDGLKKGLSDRDPKDGQALAREWFNYAEERVPQMQEQEMQTRLLLNFAVNEAKDPKQRSIQRPRAFYRRDLEAHPFVVAKP